MNGLVILKESQLFKTIYKAYKIIYLSYQNSNLKKFVYKWNIAWKRSCPQKILNAYINKKPFFKYSVTYKLIMMIAGVFDKLFGWFNKIGTCLLKGSKVAKETKNVVNTPLSTVLRGLGLLCLSIPTGSMLYYILTSKVTIFNAACCATIFVFGLVLTFFSSFDKTLKNSFIVKLVVKFIDLIR